MRNFEKIYIHISRDCPYSLNDAIFLISDHARIDFVRNTCEDLVGRGRKRLDLFFFFFFKRDLDTASVLCHISAPRDSGFSIRPVILEESADNVAAALFLVTGPL